MGLNQYVCLIKIIFYKNYHQLNEMLINILFKQYHYYNNFIIKYFNRYYYLYLKSDLSNKPCHWTVFSYSTDKYYTSINLNYKNTNSYFLKMSEFVLDESENINSLIMFKKLNSSFVSPQKINDYAAINYYVFNKFQTENLYKNVLDYTHTMLNTSNESDDDIDFSVNTFKFNTKLNIRSNRKILLKFLNFRLKRQYRVTKYVNNFVKFKVKNILNFFEMSAENILMLAKFVFTSVQCYDLFNNHCVYLNGVVLKNPLRKLKNGDNLQLIFSYECLELFQI